MERATVFFESFRAEIDSAKSSKEFHGLNRKLCEFFLKFNKKDYDSFSSIYPDAVKLIIQDILENETFNKKVVEILKTEEYEKQNYENRYDLKDLRTYLETINVEEKSVVCEALSVIAISIVVLNRFAEEEDLQDLRIFFFREIKKTYIYREGKFYFATICMEFEKILFNYKYSYKIQNPKQEYIEWVTQGKQLLRIAFLMISQLDAIQSKFRNVLRQASEDKRKSIVILLSYIYNACYRYNKGIEHCLNHVSKREEAELFISRFQEKNEIYTYKIIELITEGLNLSDGEKYYEKLSDKISKSDFLLKELYSFAQENFSAFKNTDTDKFNEWSNKIYLASYSCLSVLSAIKNAKDDRWQIKVAIRYLTLWVEDVYQIVNKFQIEDDWSKIENFLKEENERIEWKSSFQLSVNSPEGIFRDKIVSKKILGEVVKAILGFINTSGGSIVVGLIEDESLIVNDEIRKLLIKKNGRVFLDIEKEFEIFSTEIDQIKRKIQDELKNLTGANVVDFNNLFTVEPIRISTLEGEATIYLISVQKSPRIFYLIKEENNTIWISLLKRANARTITVDPREK